MNFLRSDHEFVRELTDPVCSAKFLVNGRDYGSRWYIAFSKLYQESISFFYF